MITVQSPVTLTPSGGTNVVYTKVRQNGDTHQFQCLDDSDMRTRRSLDVKVSLAKPSKNAPNGYTQNRVLFYFKDPILLANGSITVNGNRSELHFDVESSDAQLQALLDKQGYSMSTSGIRELFKQQAMPA